MGEIFRGSGTGRNIGRGGIGKSRRSGGGGRTFVQFVTTPKSNYTFTITGVTKDSTGAVLASCVVQLFKTVNDLFVTETTSDGSGNYSLIAENNASQYYLVAYKAGSPDVAGTTVNTLIPN